MYDVNCIGMDTGPELRTSEFSLQQTANCSFFVVIQESTPVVLSVIVCTLDREASVVLCCVVLFLFVPLVVRKKKALEFGHAQTLLPAPSQETGYNVSARLARSSAVFLLAVDVMDVPHTHTTTKSNRKKSSFVTCPAHLQCSDPCSQLCLHTRQPARNQSTMQVIRSDRTSASPI